ncbi:MAG: DMT family transporter [Anaerolineae bacterium]|jgi:drug/metabolite transporter (DMT)-like permease
MHAIFSRLPRGSGSYLWGILLVLVTLIWGNSFIAIKHIVAYVSPLELVALRFVPVALTFGAILLPTQGRRIRSMMREEWWRLALLGLTGAVLYNIFLAWGETRVPAGSASLIIALNPTFIYILSLAFLDERFRWHRTVGLAIAFGGLYITIRWGSGEAISLSEARYALITMLAPLMWATYTVFGKSVVARHPSLLVTGASMLFAGAFSLVFVRPGLLAKLPTLPLSFWGAVLFLAWPCTVFAFLVWFGALEHMAASRMAGFIYLVPMFSVSFSHWLLGEPITPALLLGAGVLIAGVWLVNRG